MNAARYGMKAITDVVRQPEDAASFDPEREAQRILETAEAADLPLLVHMGAFYRKIGMVLRAHLIAQKREYDATDPASKTPFALRDITDEPTRDFLFKNISSFATTHGCTGGCTWCCFAAVLTSSGQVETIPLDQKKHFFDEILRRVPHREIIKKGMGGTDTFYMYQDTDPFDDPDLLELLQYLYARYGGVPFLSTVVPPRGQGLEAFKRLTADSKQYRRAEKLSEVLTLLQRGQLLLAETPFRTIEEAANLERYFDHETALRRCVSALWQLEGRVEEGAENIMVAGENLEVLNEACREIGHPLFVEGSSVSLNEIKDLTYQVRKAEFKERTGHDIEPRVTQELNRISNALRDHYHSTESEGLGGLQEYIDGTRPLSDIEAAIAAIEAPLQGRVDVGTVRVSYTRHRSALVDALVAEGRYHFDKSDRDAGPQSKPATLSGVDFFKSGKERGGFGIHCISGVVVSPFGVFNEVGGRITRDYPQGQIVVPFKGLTPNPDLSQPGDDLGHVLEHVIVIRAPHVNLNHPYQEVYVYDGLKRVRHLRFNNVSYTIENDTVVQEGVERMEDVKVRYPETYLARIETDDLVIPLEGGLIYLDVVAHQAVYQIYRERFRDHFDREIEIPRGREASLNWFMDYLRDRREDIEYRLHGTTFEDWLASIPADFDRMYDSVLHRIISDVGYIFEQEVKLAKEALAKGLRVRVLLPPHMPSDILKKLGLEGCEAIEQLKPGEDGTMFVTNPKQIETTQAAGVRSIALYRTELDDLSGADWIINERVLKSRYLKYYSFKKEEGKTVLYLRY